MHNSMSTSETIKNTFDPKQMSALINTFAQIGKDESGGVTRLAFSKEDRRAREKFSIMAEPLIGKERCEDAYKKVMGIEDLKSIRALTDLLVP